MKFNLKAASLGFMVMALLSGCTMWGSQNKENPQDAAIHDKSLPIEQRVDRIVDNMSDEDKVGQMVMIGIHGKELNEDSKYMLNEFRFGGVILFDRNMESKEQVKKLNASLQEQAKEAGEKLPLFLAIDQEGGAVARMQEKLIAVPPAEDLGKEDISKAVDYANKSGKELKDLGFNINFAPDTDLGLAYGRSFSKTDPDKVVQYGAAVAQAYKDNGLIFAFKHFPGIGKAETDLHKEENTISASREELMTSDLKPFKELIPKFDQSDYMLMVSHAKYPALDPDNPASLSKAIMFDLLRKEFNYQGVIITDDMEMGAVANHYSFSQMAVKSVQAGADIILVCHEYDHMKEAYNGILKAVKAGTISKDQLNAAVKRIVKMKLEKLN